MKNIFFIAEIDPETNFVFFSIEQKKVYLPKFEFLYCIYTTETVGSTPEFIYTHPLKPVIHELNIFERM